MTILTGDFATDSCLADRCGKTQQLNRDLMPEDAKLYLRHVEDGESIRALAREAGCHPSTILRRIRRFEARRDDPLVDRAIAQAQRSKPEFDDRQGMRVLRRLAEPSAMMVVVEAMPKAIITRNDIRTAVLERELAEIHRAERLGDPCAGDLPLPALCHLDSGAGGAARYVAAFP